MFWLTSVTYFTYQSQKKTVQAAMFWLTGHKNNPVIYHSRQPRFGWLGVKETVIYLAIQTISYFLFFSKHPEFSPLTCPISILKIRSPVKPFSSNNILIVKLVLVVAIPVCFSRLYTCMCIHVMCVCVAGPGTGRFVWSGFVQNL